MNLLPYIFTQDDNFEDLAKRENLCVCVIISVFI